MIGWLLDRLQGRSFDFGDGNAEYKSTVFGNWYVQPGQWAASARWDLDEWCRTVLLKLGPIGLCVTFARPEPVEYDWGDYKSTLTTRELCDGRELSTWLNWQHLGVCVDLHRQQMWRVEVGPVGVAVAQP